MFFNSAEYLHFNVQIFNVKAWGNENISNASQPGLSIKTMLIRR